MERGWTFGLGGVLLAVVGLLLFIHRELNSMEARYLALLVLGTVGVSFAVGWVLGFLTESGTEPGSRTRE